MGAFCASTGAAPFTPAAKLRAQHPVGQLTPLDRYMNGGREALSAEARKGLAVLRGKGNCTACHVGPTLRDEQFQKTGGAWKAPSIASTGSGLASSGQTGASDDLGRFAVGWKDADRGVFTTPTLREIARTTPYMHDGSLATLEAVVDFYDDGGRPKPHIVQRFTRSISRPKRSRPWFCSYNPSPERSVRVFNEGSR